MWVATPVQVETSGGVTDRPFAYNLNKLSPLTVVKSRATVFTERHNRNMLRWGFRALLVTGGLIAVSCGRWGYELVELDPPGDGDATCTDQTQNGSETDVDCGGDDCEPCDDDRSCMLNADCVSRVCDDLICQAPTCNDRVTNGRESDEDCGGDDCDPCSEGQDCFADSDCDTESCNQTAGVCAPAHCADGEVSADETGNDCGGSCEPCPDGDPCLVDSDCLSVVCEGNVCQEPTCDDGVENGDEDGPDCGGSCPECITGTGGSGGGPSTGGAGGSGGSTGGSGGTGGTPGAGGVLGAGGTGGAPTTTGATGGSGGAPTTTGSSGGSGGAPTTTGSSGGTGGAPTTTGASGGSGGTGGSIVGDFVVDSSSDDGTGLTLREAIDLANATAGPQVITFADSSVNPVLTVGQLPEISESVHILGTGNTVTGTVNNARCFQIQADDVRIENIEITGCQTQPIFMGAGNRVEIIDCNMHDNGGPLYIESPDGRIEGNTISGTGSQVVALYGVNMMLLDNIISGPAVCVYLDRFANNITIQGNLITSCSTGIQFSGLTGANLWHNTLAGLSGTAISVGQASGLDTRNNIISHNSGWGIQGADSDFTALDYNLFFQNTSGDCSSCSAGANDASGDPLYLNTTTYAIDPGSPAVNAGVVGIRPYNGTAPDIGYFETN